jgi:hypothetical protein
MCMLLNIVNLEHRSRWSIIVIQPEMFSEVASTQIV